MNNVTHESSIHPVPQSLNERDDSFPSSGEEPIEPLEPDDIKGILNHLSRVHYSPGVASIRAIMKYAHEKNEAVH